MLDEAIHTNNSGNVKFALGSGDRQTTTGLWMPFHFAATKVFSICLMLAQIPKVIYFNPNRLVTIYSDSSC